MHAKGAPVCTRSEQLLLFALKMLELGLFSFNLSVKSVRTTKVTEMMCFFAVIFGKTYVLNLNIGK